MNIFHETRELATCLIRFLSERETDKELLEELKKAHADLMATLLRANRIALHCLLDNSLCKTIAPDIAEEITTSRETLLDCINKALNYLYKRAKEETPSSPMY